jgi:hypothetical protein
MFYRVDVDLDRCPMTETDDRLEQKTLFFKALIRQWENSFKL